MRIELTSSSADALTTELLEALWQAGSKFKYNYISQRIVSGTCSKLAVHQRARPRLENMILNKEIVNTRKLRKNSDLQVRIELTTVRVLVRML